MGLIFIIVLYFLIGFFASTIGVIAGLGGGVIIKPLLDLSDNFNLPTIGVLSSATVFSMSAVSLLKNKSGSATLDKLNSLYIACGSVLGGIGGKAIFNYSVIKLGLVEIIGVLQSSILAILMLLILVYFNYKHRLKRYQVKNKIVIFVCGVVLGLLSSFLGIGGGPLNMALLTLLFAMNAKNAALNSIFIIFFSQLSALVLVGTSTDLKDYDLSMLGYMIAGGIVGGYIGTWFSDKITEHYVEKVFKVTILLILVINIFNIF